MKSLIGKIHKVSQLRWALVGFLFALGVPALVLVYYSLSELKWETYHRQRTLAIELTDRINLQINHWVQVEEQRAYSDYQFIVVSGDPAANYFQTSPLSSMNLLDTLPGAIGYFQVGTDGEFSSPILPGSYVDAARYGISRREYEEREQLREQVLQILLDNQLLQTQAPATPEPLVAIRSDSAGINSASAASRDADTNRYPSAPVSPEEARPSTSMIRPSSRPAQQFDQRLQAQNQELADAGVSDQSNLAFNNLRQQQAVEDSAQREKQLLRDLDIDSKLQEAVAKKTAPEPASASFEKARTARKEQSLIPEIVETEVESDSDVDAFESSPATQARVTMFESEIDPFEFSLLDSGHLVFYRKVWRQGALTIQGLVLDRETFLQRAIGREYRETLLSSVADIIVTYRGNFMSIFRGEDSYTQRLAEQSIGGEMLHQSRLAAPFNDIEIWYSINQLPAGPGAQVVRWSAIVMALVLSLGTWLLYRLGLRQMRLAQQQQDFVSAVSHELKTPLTSIRMYGEMLREGWVDELKKKQYYDYIYDESERLSRLIANVLQLARMNRKGLDVSLKSVCVDELVDNLRSKLHSQIERSGFELEINCDPNLDSRFVTVDSDGFLQIFINLVDNALKFSAKSDIKKIVLTVSVPESSEVVFGLRDFGPGIDKQHRSKIFDLFYRAENELTRQTVGTGIGLALVNQLLRAMNGRVEVHNRSPGAEFRVFLKVD
jgi:signal transduction histidine kinase